MLLSSFIPFFICFYIFVKSYSCDLENDLDYLNSKFKKLSNALRKAKKMNNQRSMEFLKNKLLKLKQDSFISMAQYKERQIHLKSVKRQVEMYSRIGDLIIPLREHTKLKTLQTRSLKTVQRVFDEFEAKVFHDDITCVQRDVHLQNTWRSFSEEISHEVLHAIDQYFDKLVEVSQILKLPSPLKLWTTVSDYEEDYLDTALSLWNKDIKSAYAKLFFYVRNNSNILKFYQENSEDSYGPIPAYLYDILFNLNTAKKINRRYATSPLLKRMFKRKALFLTSQEMSCESMARNAEKYFVSLGFDALHPSFWRDSTFTSNSKGEIIMNYYYKDDYSIQVNSEANSNTYMALQQTIFRMYRSVLLDEEHMPEIFKIYDFPAFHKAFLRAVTLSSKSFERLIDEELLKPERVTTQFKFDRLNGIAIETFTMLSSAMAMETWIWDVMNGKIPRTDRICELWNRRLKFEGVAMMTTTYPSYNGRYFFDFYSSNSILEQKSSLTDYMEIVLKYQIFARLCQLAGKYIPNHPLQYPLHECDIKGSIEAGNLIKQIMRYGSSKSWQELLGIIMGEEGAQISATGLLHYFAPILVQMPEIEAETVFEHGYPYKNFCESDDG